MNIITRIKSPDFEGKSIDYTLTQATLITGAPYTGKSSIAKALQTGMYGCLPALGDSNASVFQLAGSDRELFVRLDVSDGRQNTLTVSRNDAGATTKDFDCQVEFPRVLMDAREYLTLTRQQRLAYVLKRVDLKKAGYNEGKLLKSFITDAPDVQPPSLLVKWGKAIDTSLVERQREKMSVYEWMESLLARFAVGEKEAKRQAKTAQAILASVKTSSEPEAVDDKAIEAAQVALRKATEAATVKVSQELIELREHAGSLQRAIKNAVGDVDAMEQGALKMHKRTCCPTCLAKGKGWLNDWDAENDKAIASMKAALKKDKQELADTEAKIAALEKKSKAKNQQALDAAREVAQKAVNALHEKRVTRLTWEANQKQVKDAQADAKAAASELAVVKHMQATLVAEQARLVENAFSTLLTVARKFTDGLLRAPLVYANGELGMMRGGHWVSHETFSGTEMLLAYAGLQVALAQESPIKLVVFDEFGVMPDDWQQRITQRMFDLLDSGVADQWVVISCRDSFLTNDIVKRLTVINVRD